MIKLPDSILRLQSDSVRRTLAGQSLSQNHGRSARSNGQSFEDCIQSALDSLKAIRHVASFQRNDARKIEKSGNVKARIPSGCDFTGILLDGTGFAIECKSGNVVYASKEHALIAGKDRSPRISPEQRRQLDEYDAHAIALLAVRSTSGISLVRWRSVASNSPETFNASTAYICRGLVRSLKSMLARA